MTRAEHSIGVRRTSAAAAGLILLIIAGVRFAPVASAQPTGLIAQLKAGIVCGESSASDRLMRNANGSGADLNDILMALDEISIDPKACPQIKDAASALALKLDQDDNRPQSDSAVANVFDDAADTVAVADLRLQQILAEADKRAASMRFEVGPPPRKMTRNREAPR
jgi:hypothetical protein